MATMANVCMRSAKRISSLAQVFTGRQVCTRQPSFRLWSTASNTNGKPQETTASTESSETPEAVPSEIEVKLKEANAKLEEELKSFKDKYIRSLAETENVRQRMNKQVEDTKNFGIQGFCKDLLDVADVLNMAVDNTPKDELSKNSHLQNLFEGLTMTESQLQKVFAKHGLVKITPKIGDKFDPFIHEAMFQVPSENKESNSNIAAVTKIGYKLKDRTIRPAVVGVFKS